MTALAALQNFKPLSVLLIEDSATEARALRHLLTEAKEEHFDLHEARRLSEAIALIPERHIDVAVVDLGLPDARGPESLVTLARHYPHLPLVVLSGQTDAMGVLRALEFGAQEFLVKGECDGAKIRQAIYNAFFRKQIRRDHE